MSSPATPIPSTQDEFLPPLSHPHKIISETTIHTKYFLTFIVIFSIPFSLMEITLTLEIS
jgi:hypothetical protein